MPPSLSTKYNKSSHHRVLFTLIKYLDLGELTILQTDDLRGNADERFLVIEFGEKQQQQSDGGRRRHRLHMCTVDMCVCLFSSSDGAGGHRAGDTACFFFFLLELQDQKFQVGVGGRERMYVL